MLQAIAHPTRIERVVTRRSTLSRRGKIDFEGVSKGAGRARLESGAHRAANPALAIVGLLCGPPARALRLDVLEIHHELLVRFRRLGNIPMRPLHQTVGSGVSAGVDHVEHDPALSLIALPYRVRLHEPVAELVAEAFAHSNGDPVAFASHQPLPVVASPP